MVAEGDVGGDQGGAVGGRGSENPEGLAERDRGLVGHPSELTAADHADNGQTGVGIHRRKDYRAPDTPLQLRAAYRHGSP
ncbi:hypothetical protein Pme01_31220 [Planosporangium mesophilum]|uniref:Uncharacterized protein n=1 Tax=Planosporangium mesophilum TaxID=689768 RepID=A0A8J3X0M3_9ACTN|nr:hypothetical protein Pme01_31220 [Planosporangium mesophilum]